MLLKFSLLLLPGAFLIAGLAFSAEQEESTPRAQKPVPRQAIPPLDSEYVNYLGFCFSEDLWEDRATRGDILLFGKTQKSKVLIRGALYRLRGPSTNDDNTISIRGGRGFRRVESVPLPDSKRWRKVIFRSSMPRKSQLESPGEFTFQFGNSALSQSCKWKFRF